LNGLPQSMPKTFGGVPAVLPEAGPATSMVRARIDLNAAFDWPSHFSSVECCDDRLNSPNTPAMNTRNCWSSMASAAA
jgi:hypothetical protein